MIKRKTFLLNVIISMVFSIILVFSGTAVADTCKEWVAKAVSVQGSVQVRLSGQAEWKPVQLNDVFCPGDMVRVREQGRSAMVLSNETIIRLNEKTTITFSGVEKKETSLLDLLRGAVHFISRFPRTLKIVTPFVNGTVEGTEFLVEVDKDESRISVFEGQVLALNQTGSIMVTSGQFAVAESGKAPVLRAVVRPRDAVQWALYYPPILMHDVADIKDFQEDFSDPRMFTSHASMMLAVGRVGEARKDIEKALSLAPEYSDAIALQSIIAVVQNEKDEALRFAKEAVEAGPDSSAARIALSYAQQANFDLDGALSSLQEAVKVAPENSLAWARLSELWASFGNLDKALDAAQQAVALRPDLSRTQSVLGFAYLAQVKTEESKRAFGKAIEFDQADPLPRLGLGLAKIREGNLNEGRREIEIATSLDPNQSLIRSYLGKSYYEEKRDKFAKGQFDIAEELDPFDPTPFFYNAIRKQSINRPVEALHDMQKAIELNNNRAIYRSKMLLDDDLAARSAGLARIYSDLGFQQLALVEGWKSVNTDPANYSAHRFLADSYSALPRHEIARVSELLQSQLLQPLNITPVQPSLAESNLLILDGAGPGDLSFNEFNPLFNRNRFALQISGLVGGNSTLGDELTVSGVYNKFSVSAGQFHYETDGFRKNNDQDLDIYNVFMQASLSHKTTIQTEARFTDSERGDLPLFFDPDRFFPYLREEKKTDNIRFGLHHGITPNSDFIASVMYGSVDSETTILSEFKNEFDDDGYIAEVQYLYRTERLKITGGAGHFSSDGEEVTTSTFIMPPLPPFSDTTRTDRDTDHTNLYVYTQINYPKTVTWTLGASADFFDDGIVDHDQFNPKIGLTWKPLSKTTLRAAVFRTLNRSLISSQTIEPTQVAGFNQLFDDGPGTDAWRYGVGIDQKFSDQVYAGAEFSKRDLDEPGQLSDPVTFALINKEFDVDEELGRAYVYWTPYPWLALSAEYQFEHFDNPEEFMKDDISDLDTHRLILGAHYFHPCGFFAKFKPAYISQQGNFAFFGSSNPFATVKGEDDFWVVDASIGYRLPKRYGIITVEARNLFDENFRFQDTDPSNPTIYPERLVLVKVTLAL
jgi:tetratricopeptide (TPR) repeat protein